MIEAQPKRHFFIPDAQIRPDEPNDFVDWIALALVEYKPDTIICIGDFWDCASLNSHEKPGSLTLEGARYADDIRAGNEAFERLCLPMETEIKRLKDGHRPRWTPRKIFCEGNHEDRITRVASEDSKLFGTISTADCNTRDFERHGFLERVYADGVCYSHFFQQTFSNRPIGGTALNKLNKVGQSFAQGHQQGFDYATRTMGTGKTQHGFVAGSCYTQIESYRGAQCQRHWRGVIILNDVQDGEFDIMPLSLRFLCKRYTGDNILHYHQLKYPHKNWDHLA